MQGTITSFGNNIGIISGYDGKQYEFVRLDWDAKDQLPKVGMEVDFNNDGGSASNIVILRSPSAHSKNALAAWCFFLGGFGIHRFTVGKTWTGLLLLFIPAIPPAFLLILTLLILFSPDGGMHFPSLGPLMIFMAGSLWAIFDFIKILSGNFTDKNGNKIT